MKKLIALFIMTMGAMANGETKESVYSDLYYNSWRPRHCGQNIAELVQTFDRKGVDLAGYRVLKIDNAGLSLFLMINAEKVRDGDKTTELNWHFHVVLVGPNNEVYDPSFDTKPRVIPMAQYLEEMFLNEEECDRRAQYGEHCIGQSRKLREYRMTWYDAAAYLDSADPILVDRMGDHY